MKQKYILVAGLLFFLINFTLFTINSSAESSALDHIVITEIQTSGINGATDEFVEIFNPTNSDINLENFKLYKLTKTNTSTKHILVEFPQGSTIHSKKYLLLTHQNYSNSSTPADFIFVDGETIASDNTVVLENKNGEIIDLVGYGNATVFEGIAGAEAPTNSKNIARIWSNGDFVDTNDNAADFIKQNPNPQNSLYIPPPPNNPPTAIITLSTSTYFVGNEILFDAQNSTDDQEIISFEWNFGDGNFDFSSNTFHTFIAAGEFEVSLTVKDNNNATNTVTTTIFVNEKQIVYEAPAKIKINEFIPNPAEGNEWVEFYNGTTSTVSLNGWLLLDNASTSTLEGSISPFDFFVYEYASSKLNNSGDFLKLIAPNGETMDEVYYGEYGGLSAPQKGHSIARKENGVDTGNTNDFAETETPTKNSGNVITQTIVTPPPPPNNNSHIIPPVYSPDPTYPNIGNIIINEILPNPIDSDTEKEFIEIYNADNKTISLENWQLGDDSTKRYVFTNKTIAAGEYLTIYRSESKIALNNTGEETVKLFNSSSALVDSIHYSDTAKEGQSYNRDDDGWFWSDFLTPNAQNQKPLTKEPTEILAPTSTQGEFITDEEFLEQNTGGFPVDFELLSISEIFPNPAGEDADEFIEIYNSADYSINLEGLQIDDSEGGSKPYFVPKNTFISANGFMVFWKKDTKLALNNDGDSVRLLYPDDSVITEVSYEKTNENASYAKTDNGFVWSLTPTPNAKNTIQKIENKKTTNVKTILNLPLEKVRDADIGDNVRTQGVVSVLPGVLGSQYFYIANENAGLQIYLHSKDFPDLKVGDLIEINGEISKAYGNLRLKIKTKQDIKMLNFKGAPEPKLMDIEGIGEDFEGSLVQISGEVTEVKGSYIYVDDGTEEIKVYFKKETHIDRRPYKTADLVSVSGIVSKTTGGYQILPRENSDITKTGVSDYALSTQDNVVIEKENNAVQNYLTATAGAFTSLVLGLFAHSKRHHLGVAFAKLANLIRKV